VPMGRLVFFLVLVHVVVLIVSRAFRERDLWTIIGKHVMALEKFRACLPGIG